MKAINKQAGFTLIEIVLAILIFSFSFLGILAAQYRSSHDVAYNTTMNKATQIGQSVADSLEAEGVSAIDTGAFVLERQEGTRTYTVNLNIQPSVVASEVSALGVQAHVVTKTAEIQVLWTVGTHQYDVTMSTEIR